MAGGRGVFVLAVRETVAPESAATASPQAGQASLRLPQEDLIAMLIASLRRPPGGLVRDANRIAQACSKAICP